MDIQKIQSEIFGYKFKDDFFTSTTEVKKSIYGEIDNRNLLLDLLDSPSILPLFNPIEYNDMKELIARSDLKHVDSKGNNALLMAMDKNIGAEHIEHIMSKSNLAHKNKDGINALTLAVLNQNLLPTNLLYDIHNSKDETFSRTRKSLSQDFYENRNITPEALDNKYQALKRVLKKYEEKLKDKNSKHTDVFTKYSLTNSL